jgi:hypothetical protein
MNNTGYIIGIIFLGLVQNALSQQKDSTLQFLGNLYEKESFQPVPYAHIINLNSNRATISDTLGNFDIVLSPGDTLMITSIGYEQKHYQYPGQWKKVIFRSIPLKRKTYSISKVEVTPWGTYADFKNRFMNLDINSPKEKIHPLLWEDLPQKPDKPKVSEPGINSPVSMIYNMFSEEAKERRKYRELLKKQRRAEKIRSKFNRDHVSSLTGLKGNKLDRFMEFCNFSDAYILETREYFILERVKKKYRQFMKLDSLNLTD